MTPTYKLTEALNATDLGLIQDFMRTVETGEGTKLEVGIVLWDRAHTPSIEWKPYLQWPQHPAEQELFDARKKALHARKFFKICHTCKERCNVGHMFDARICQSCASRDLGVVF